MKPEDAAFAIATGVRPVINSVHQAKVWAEAGGGLCDLMVDSGINRLGLPPGEVGDPAIAALQVDTLMSHLASADDPAQDEFTRRQLDKFAGAVRAFREGGFAPTLIHAANSAATFAHPAAGNMVRPGGALYGFRRDVFPPNIEEPPLKPVMSLYTRIMLLKEVPKGAKLGYGGSFETRRDSLIATLPIGYDDGYRRALSNRGRVIVRGQFASIAGRVSMDLTLIDVTDISGVQLNDKITLLGKDGEQTITAEEIGQMVGTISYEITCGISNRVPRIYT
jgi:alanine racemase